MNLFLGLSRYSLKPEKSPLENFCTEVLAWCLQNSEDFRREFFKLARPPFQHDLSGPLEIATQQYWAANQEEDTHDSRKSGFFDLEIQSPPNRDGSRRLLIAIESKMGAPFGQGQLEKYRAELALRATIFDHCYLVILTTHSDDAPSEFPLIKWSEVQNLLTNVCVSVEFAIIYRQFSEFLKEKGIFPMKINPISSEMLKNWQNSFIFQRDLLQILTSLLKDESLKPLLKKKDNRVTFEPSRNNSELWLGIYGAGNPLDYLGFGVLDIAGTPRLQMMISGKFAGRILEADIAKQIGRAPALATASYKIDPCKNGETWLNFYKPIEGKCNGNAENIHDWLLRAAHELSKVFAIEPKRFKRT